MGAKRELSSFHPKAMFLLQFPLHILETLGAKATLLESLGREKENRQQKPCN